MCFSSGNIS
ncbi:hypothetical protein YPPY58_1150, partial [Yersinia pestis PY-58]